MWDIWKEIERVNRRYPESAFPVGSRKIPDTYRYIRRSELVYPLDNGFLLDFLYSNEDGSVVVKARRYYETELALEEAIQLLKQQFTEELKKYES